VGSAVTGEGFLPLLQSLDTALRCDVGHFMGQASASSVGLSAHVSCPARPSQMTLVRCIAWRMYRQIMVRVEVVVPYAAGDVLSIVSHRTGPARSRVHKRHSVSRISRA
jgi:hypothetical protein